jgi:hypothetical protein
VHLASTQAWGRHRAYRVQRVNMTMMRRQCRRPRVHRACLARLGSMQLKEKLCVVSVQRDTTTTIGIRRHHVTAAQVDVRLVLSRCLVPPTAQIVQLARQTMTRTRRHRVWFARLGLTPGRSLHRAKPAHVGGLMSTESRVHHALPAHPVRLVQWLQSPVYCARRAKLTRTRFQPHPVIPVCRDFHFLARLAVPTAHLAEQT